MLHNPNAENISSIPYTIRTQKPSRFIPGKMVDGEDLLGCPKCSHVGKMPDHGEIITCKHCGLNVQRWGASLDIWSSEKVTQPKTRYVENVQVFKDYVVILYTDGTTRKVMD